MKVFRFTIVRACTSILTGLALYIAAGCKETETTDPGTSSGEDVLSGGATTVFVEGMNAYSLPAPNLSPATLSAHLTGSAQFDENFVPAPAASGSGLGPLFNNSSCISCHLLHGRGRPPLYSPERLTSMVILISIPGADATGGPNPVPGFGIQLQQRSSIGVEDEGSVSVHWNEIPGTYGDGTPYSLRKTFLVTTGRVPPDVLMSPRMAPPVYGLGLLEAVDEHDIIALADEFDRDADSVSGRPNYVWDKTRNQLILGRFGWKAGQPTILQQNAIALNEDMGVTNPYYPVENCFGTSAYDSLTDDPEVSDSALSYVTTFTQSLGVPARRNASDATVKRGLEIFQTIGCASCHVENMKTSSRAELRELAGQEIHPYTDLLLHDMGAELSDERPEFTATGTEWRTPPLWGIGQAFTVSGGYVFYLHDGRARSFEEAILWHGGEGAGSAEKFRTLPIGEREALVAFLKSL